MVNQNRKACAYCGRQTNITTDKCENCGSTTFESLEQAVQHQEQHRQFNQTHQPQAAEQKKTLPHNKKMNIIALIVIVIVMLVTFSVIMSQCDRSGVKTTYHNKEEAIRTDWFEMTVYEGKIIRTKNTYCGLNTPTSGFERVLVDINLNNYVYGENLDINIDEDFYLESDSTIYPSKNSGGSYSVFDKLSTDGMFFGKFMISPKAQLHGYIAFDIPAYAQNLRFVYIEYNYEDGARTTIKHYYKVDLEYDTPKIPSGSAQTFYDKAYDAGYVIEIINDYGYGMFWAGAHKYVDESAKGLTEKPKPVYWIDLTKDISVHNAEVEYEDYVNKVKEIRGSASAKSGTLSGKSYQYQSNTSSTEFGVAYQIDVYNYLVESAPIDYKQEILDFFDSIDLKVVANNVGDAKITTHSVNNSIWTDWFKMTVYDSRIIRAKNSYCGLSEPSFGYERVLIDINLDNYLYEENLDINVAEDFYLESGSEKYFAKNTGGSYTVFDKLSVDGMFFGKFMVSTKKQLHGYIAFDVPSTAENLRFVYKEYNFEGDERTTVKHYYKIDLDYEVPAVPAGKAQDFYIAAYNAGYVLEIMNDYDGYGTFWIGAFKYIDDSSKGITKKPEPVYWVDFTQDLTEHNAKVEYNRYVNKVKLIGGTESANSGNVAGKDYQFQSNSSSTKFGIAYQIDSYNYLVESAPIASKQEILTFLDSLGLVLT